MIHQLSKIHLLSDDLINKIAAGEVVERPASVVKELIENSIDAGATQIAVEIQDAGRKLIRVSDNGRGMIEEEIGLALQRHSTSKISSLDDLFNIKTLGFRGEALPSIASVSKLKIWANPSGAGLTVEAADLFYNTPARRKFMKANSTEVGHAGDIVAKYLLANPQIAFKFTSDGKPLISSTGNGKLMDAILAVYGAELTRALIDIDHHYQLGRVFGYVSCPTLSRLDKNYETFFVNGRFVRNFLLNRALEEAYRTLIPGNRYPVAVVFIEIDPKQVDVNVHPTKREVKFANNQVVMEAVRGAVKAALGNVQSPKSEVGSASDSGHWTNDFGRSQVWQPNMMEPFFSINNQQLTINNNEGEINISSVQPLIPIYQLKLTYIIATDGEELVLIDQHAAHERVIFDRISQKSEVQSRQALLVPETIDLNIKERVVLKDNIAYLQALGFDLEEFGGNAFLLRAVPAVSAQVSARQLLLDLISDLQESDKSTQLEAKQENVRKLVACHSAIKAGDKLTQAEMSQLIRDLYITQSPLTCPHGRPTMVKITEAEIARRFGR